MALEQRKKKTRVSKKLQLSATYIFMKTKLMKRRVYKCVYFLNTTFLLCKLQNNKNYTFFKYNFFAPYIIHLIFVLLKEMSLCI